MECNMSGELIIGKESISLESANLEELLEKVQKLPEPNEKNFDFTQIKKENSVVIFQRESCFLEEQNNPLSVRHLLTVGVHSCIIVYFYNTVGDHLLIHCDFNHHFDFAARLQHFKSKEIKVVLAGGSNADWHLSQTNAIAILAELLNLAKKYYLQFEIVSQKLIASNKVTEEDEIAYAKYIIISWFNRTSQCCFSVNSTLKTHNTSFSNESPVHENGKLVMQGVVQILQKKSNKKELLQLLSLLKIETYETFQIFASYLFFNEGFLNLTISFLRKNNRSRDSHLVNFGFDVTNHQLVTIPFDFSPVEDKDISFHRCRPKMESPYVETFSGQRKNEDMVTLTREYVTTYEEHKTDILNYKEAAEFYLGIRRTLYDPEVIANIDNILVKTHGSAVKDIPSAKKDVDDLSKQGQELLRETISTNDNINNNTEKNQDTFMQANQALKLFEQALDLSVKLYSEKSRAVALLTYNMGRCYELMEMPGTAANYFNKSWHVRKALKMECSKVEEAIERNNKHTDTTIFAHQFKQFKI